MHHRQQGMCVLSWASSWSLPSGAPRFRPLLPLYDPVLKLVLYKLTARQAYGLIYSLMHLRLMKMNIIFYDVEASNRQK